MDFWTAGANFHRVALTQEQLSCYRSVRWLMSTPDLPCRTSLERCTVSGSERGMTWSRSFSCKLYWLPYVPAASCQLLDPPWLILFAECHGRAGAGAAAMQVPISAARGNLPTPAICKVPSRVSCWRMRPRTALSGILLGVQSKSRN